MYIRMTSLQILVLIFFTTVYTVIADPICRPSSYDTSNVVCLPGPGGENYVLKRWLVSDNKQTTKVSLRGCGISEVDYESFYGMSSLRDIDLGENRLSELKLGVLDGIRDLFRLNLSNNSLSDFPLGLFDQMPELNTLDLKGNRLENIKVGVFDPLSKLRYLDLSSNAILGRKLNPAVFDHSRLIRFMDFSRNDMSDTDENLLRAFQDIEFLNLDRCSLDEVPAFTIKPNLRTMKRLFVSTNYIRNIDNPTTFANLESLEDLNLSWNALSSVHENVFKPLRNLKIIELSHNKLKHLPETLFQNMPALNNVNLADNFIKFVPVNAFRGIPLKNLNMSRNRFTYLTDNFCLELNNSGALLRKFYFNQNPWQCKCLLDIINEVQKMKIEYNTAKYDGAHAVCVSDEFVCKRHDNFNDIYDDLYNELVLKS